MTYVMLLSAHQPPNNIQRILYLFVFDRIGALFPIFLAIAIRGLGI